MLMQAEPVYLAYEAVRKKIAERKPAEAETEEPAEAEQLEEKPVTGSEEEPVKEKKLRVVYLSPQGDVFSQGMAEELAKEEDLVLLCGHYEGIDERVLEEIVTDYVSIGDYVLTGGELPAMVLIDCVIRHVDGVLGNDESACDESFSLDGLLEYPQYSRPAVWHGREVPAILLSGNHKEVAKWRRKQSLRRTRLRRPDMYEKLDLSSKQDRKLLKEMEQEDLEAGIGED